MLKLLNSIFIKQIPFKIILTRNITYTMEHCYSNISESQNNAKGKKPGTKVYRKFKIKYKVRSIFMECSKKKLFSLFSLSGQENDHQPWGSLHVSTLKRSITLGNHDSAPIDRSSVFKDINWRGEKLKSALSSFWYHLTLQP